GPSHGTVTFSADGGFSYDPDDAYLGQDTVTYLAGDTRKATPATVYVTVYASDPTPAYTIKLVGDTNRDGVVTEADEPNRDRWAKTSGAIFAVNHDDNNGDHKPDAVDFRDDGHPYNENFTIENDADAAQLAPLVIRKTGPLPPNTRVFLRLL